MSIIAAVDLSAPSINAARAGAQLARLLNQPLMLVRAIEPVSALYPELLLAGALDLDDTIRAGAHEALENIRLMLQDLAPGIAIEARVQAGAPHDVLITCAREENAQLIVMGTQARGPLGRLLIGSAAQRTMRAAPCAVLVLREGATPFAAWAEGKRPLKVMAGVDRSPASEAAIAFIAKLRAAGPCDVALVHEYWPPGEYIRLGLRGPRDLAHDDEQVVTVLNREMRELWAELPPLPNAGTVSTRVRAGWNAPGLELALDADAASADLLVLGTTQAHGLARLRSGSDALTALHNCHVPVLVVPARTQQVAASEAPIPVIRSVLVATDLSTVGNAAVPHAYALAQRPGSRVEILHVHERAIPSPAYVMPDQGTGMTTPQRHDLERTLTSLVPQAAEERGISSHVTVIDGGSAAEQILQAAHRLGVDAVVLASHGKGGVNRSLFGSVTQGVLHKSDLPVYVVRPAR